MKTILTFSGGLDSTILLYKLLSEGHEVRCLSVDYGQRHRKELLAASNICRNLMVKHRIADLKPIKEFLAGSSQTSDIEVPEGHYAEDSMKATVVPNRNMLLLSVATAWGVSSKSDFVAYAAHSGDHAIYPDCRSEFADALGVAISLCDWYQVKLVRPFIGLSKADLVRIGAELKVQFKDTWSCYKGQELHCGKCGTCNERREAFELAGVQDPTEYQK